MARAEDVRALEALCPWDRAEFRADLAALSGSTAAAARAYAADARVLARLAGQVPRCRDDESGGTPWTSFRQEVAVARSISGPAAAAEIRTAVRLTTVLGHTLDLLDAGRITVHRARVFVDELEVYDDELARQIDHDLADRAAMLAPWRIKDLVRLAALSLDPDRATLRTAVRTADRRVSLHPDRDDQASVLLSGPAVPLVRWHSTLDQRARALRQAGDPRTLDALRFDLATSTYPCATHPPTDPTTPDPTTPDPSTPEPSTPDLTAAQTPADDASTLACPRADDDSAEEHRGQEQPGQEQPGQGQPAGDDTAAAGLRPSGVEAASVDCRRSRPVQAGIVVPVETALGLSNEPSWLDGYGWISAPTSRLLLVDAELRRRCAQTGTGALVDLAERHRRLPPTPDGVRAACLDMVLGEITLSDVGWRTEPQHDPSEPLHDFVTQRDRSCDGPTQSRSPATACELDHNAPHPTGPTAAWNLAARNARTHHLKHDGWTPIRTPTSTIWTSPAGQVVEVPHHTPPPPGFDPDRSGPPPALPDPLELAATDRSQLTPPADGLTRPWLPATEQPEPTPWTWLDNGTDQPAPF